MTRRVIVLRPFTALLALLALALLASACSPSRSPDPPAKESAPPPSPPLWGDMKPVVSVKELMKYTIDPVADNVFNAVGSTLTKKGMVEWEPKTDEDWEKVTVGAVSLAESVYLLKVPRPFAPAGDLNNSTGPDAVEMSPAEITAKVERDPVEWNARIETLRNATLAGAGRLVSAQNGQAAATKPPTVDETFKNVQALKGLTVDDFMLTMGIMSAAVGSDCVGCHPSAGTDNVDWAFDTPRKRTARRMVQMVAAINRDNFGGRQMITCWSCHRGRDRPVTTMTLDVVYGPPNED